MTTETDGHNQGRFELVDPDPDMDPRMRVFQHPGDQYEDWALFLPKDADLRMELLYALILSDIAPDWVDNPHMRDTPQRIARWWREFIDYDPGTIDTTFPVEHVDQMVVVRNIDTWSLCAHHLLPFSARVSIGYIADDQVLGLSKFARIAQLAAHKPTSQEQLCAEVADKITEVTGTQDVAVTATGSHLCMAMRGIKSPATMTTSVTRGAFRDSPEARQEWLALLSRG